MGSKRRKVTIPELQRMKERGEKISFLTAYDYPTARLEDEAGIEMILVGDSAAMCMLGHDTTLPITMDEMVTFCRAVTRGARYAFVVGDLPFMSYQPSDRDAVVNAGRLLAEGGADAVKLEGGRRILDRVRAISDAGIAVMGHIGLTPQSQSQLGGFRSQGRRADAALELLRDAADIEEAGAFALLIEAVPAEVGEAITQRLSIPVLSIGAGSGCDGQLLIVHDMLGLFDAFQPRFVRRYAQVGTVMTEAFCAYREDVKTGRFPEPRHQYPIPDEELASFRASVETL